MKLTATISAFAFVILGLNVDPASSLAQKSIATAVEPTGDCTPLSRPGLFDRPPVAAFGVSFGFERRVLRAFPIGSCENELVSWMDRMGFSPGSEGDADTFFIDEPDEFERSGARRREGRAINLRRLIQEAMIGRSYFMIAWNADGGGRLTEVYADTEIFKLDIP